jgi:hypothetical protein
MIKKNFKVDSACNKTSRDLQMLLAAVVYLAEGLTLQTLLTLKVEKLLIISMVTWRSTISFMEHLILFLKTKQKGG